MTKLSDIEGIGPAYAEKLSHAGIRSTEKLLVAGRTPKSRKELAEKTGVSEGMLLEWINHADLFRVKGIGSEYSDLLEAAGVDTVKELAQRKPENLVQKLVEVNCVKKCVRRLPTAAAVAGWVASAKELPRMIEY